MSSMKTKAIPLLPKTCRCKAYTNFPFYPTGESVLLKLLVSCQNCTVEILTRTLF